MTTIKIKFYDTNGASMNNTIPNFDINTLSEFTFHNDAEQRIMINIQNCGQREILSINETFPLGSFYIENKKILHISTYKNKDLKNSKISNLDEFLMNIIKIYFNEFNFKTIKIFTNNIDHPLNKIINAHDRLKYYNDFTALNHAYKLIFV